MEPARLVPPVGSTRQDASIYRYIENKLVTKVERRRAALCIEPAWFVTFAYA